MNWLDMVIAIILVVNLFVGLRTGLIKMVISFLGLVLGTFLAGRYYPAMADRLTFISSDKAAGIAAYVIILILVMVAAAIAAWLLRRMLSMIMLGWLDHVGGAILGLFMAGVFVGAILAIWAKLGVGSSVISSSLLARFLLDKFPIVLALLPGEFGSIRSFLK